ncbi:MAG: hypothetical protein JF610_10905, partial [Acidobacteria bacterium]|nr:hypothetical protein [Acidobacteriota bacterium]
GLAGRLRGRRWTSVLIVAELALTLVLLAGTGLLVRSFVAVYRAVAAVGSRDVVTARLALPLQKYATPVARLAFFDRLTERLAADAAIEEFAVASEMPFMPVPGAPRELTLDGQVTTPGDIQPSVSAVFVSPRYFAIVGLPLVRVPASSGICRRCRPTKNRPRLCTRRCEAIPAPCASRPCWCAAGRIRR